MLQFGMNFLTKATIPKNDCKLVMLVGQFKLSMAATFWVGLNAFTTDYMSQEGQTLLIKLAVSGLGKKLNLPKGL